MCSSVSPCQITTLTLMLCMETAPPAPPPSRTQPLLLSRYQRKTELCSTATSSDAAHLPPCVAMATHMETCVIPCGLLKTCVVLTSRRYISTERASAQGHKLLPQREYTERRSSKVVAAISTECFLAARAGGAPFHGRRPH